MTPNPSPAKFARYALFFFALCSSAGCLDRYELSLSGPRPLPPPPTTDAGPAHDAGSGRDHDSGITADDDASIATDDAGLSVRSCDSDDQCKGLRAAICDSTAHVCYECASDSDCQERRGFPHCNLVARACEGCVVDTDCEDGTRCDIDARICTRPCSDDSACSEPARPTCKGGLCQP